MRPGDGFHRLTRFVGDGREARTSVATVLGCLVTTWHATHTRSANARPISGSALGVDGEAARLGLANGNVKINAMALYGFH